MSTDIPATPIVSRDPIKPLSPSDLLTTPSHLDLVNMLMGNCNNMLEQGKDSITFGYQMVGPALKAVIKSFEDAGWRIAKEIKEPSQSSGTTSSGSIKLTFRPKRSAAKKTTAAPAAGKRRKPSGARTVRYASEPGGELSNKLPPCTRADNEKHDHNQAHSPPPTTQATKSFDDGTLAYTRIDAGYTVTRGG